jgi:hypothetical protein
MMYWVSGFVRQCRPECVHGGDHSGHFSIAIGSFVPREPDAYFAFGKRRKIRRRRG